MPRSRTTTLATLAFVLLLATGCGGGDESPDPGEPASGTPTATPTPTPDGEPAAHVCSAVTDAMASQWYGRTVSVDDRGASCSLQEKDFLEQDINVMWEFDDATGLTLRQARRGLGVRSDDAVRVELAGGVPAWEVRMTDVQGVIVTTVVDGDLLTVFASSTLLHKPYRPIPELVGIARGIAETYTG